MSAKATERVLRIGIIQGGKIVEERLLRKRQRVTIGLSKRNTFLIPVGTLQSHVLFDVQRGGFELCFTSKMDGRVAVDGDVLDFASLKEKNVARRRGDTWHLPLSDQSRGKVVLGDVTVLFQFVAPPPVPAPPKLPAVARGGWIKSIDWVYASTVVAVGIIEVGLFGYMNTLERTKKGPPKLESLDARFARLLVPELQRIEPQKQMGQEAKAKPGEGDKKGGEEGKKKGRRRVAAAEETAGDSVEAAKDAARDRAAIREKVRGVGLLKVLGTQGPGGVADKAVADVFAEGGHDRDLDTTFRKAGEIRVAETGLERTRAPKGGGAEGVGTTETLSDEKVAGVGRGRVRRVRVERGEERVAPKATIGTGAAEVEGGSLDPDKIAVVVKRRLAAVKGCYEKQLNRNPDLRGKITVRFTIGPTGAVVDISTESNTMGDDEVAQCIMNRMRGWRFPKPEGGSVTVSYPFIFTTSKG
jgi:TonB family protein